MERKFKHNLIIRVNTLELRRKLKELGYWECQNGYNEWHIPIENLPFLVTDQRGFYKGENGIWDDILLDCGVNEERFLELAAITCTSSK